MPTPKKARKPPSDPGPKIAAILAFVRLFATIVENFGWPGALVILGWVSVWLWSTDLQKNRIIELYILGTGVAGIWPVVVLGLLFVLATLAQRGFYLAKIGVLNEELAREGREKSALQAKLSGMDLQHAQTRTPGKH